MSDDSLDEFESEEDREEDKSIKQGVMKPASKNLSFLRTDDHDLVQLLKGLKKVQRAALRRLAEGMQSTDEKVAIDCAKTLLTMSVQVSKEISEDSIKRLLAEVRKDMTTQLPGMKDVSETKEATRPLVDFTTIREVE